MSYTTQFRWGPEQTPSLIQKLIIITSATTILSALIDLPLAHLFSMPGPQILLSLSWYGISNFFIWEPLSYMFVQYNWGQGITLFFLIGLLFNMYMLWILGSAIYEQVGPKSFLGFYFTAGIVSAIAALVFMPLSGQYPVLSGPTPTILALFMVWTMSNPDNELLFFFLFPIKAKWLMAGILGAIFLVCLSQWDVVNFIFYFSGAIIGYVYGAIAWEMRGPFAFTHGFDRMLSNLGLRYRVAKIKAEQKKQKEETSSKIIDMSTGEPVMEDDKFVDEMLAKISKHGEKSLTWNERRRMRKISEKKAKEK